MAKSPNITPEAIKNFREERGLSQQDLASILGVGVATISRWEAGNIHPTGTAAVILRTVVITTVPEGTVDLMLASGQAIYQLLKEVFENTNKQFPPR